MTPARIWNVVVLPAPSGPINPKISPSPISRLIPQHGIEGAVAFPEIADSDRRAPGRGCRADRPSPLWNPRPSFVEPARRPDVALDENLAIGRHAGFGESGGRLEQQLDADHLLHAVVAEVSILRRERGLRIDALNESVDRLDWAPNRDTRARAGRSSPCRSRPSGTNPRR